jgi:spermidine synthase
MEEITPGEYHVLTVESETHIQKSEFNKIEVLEIQGYGRGLFLDGRIQNVAADEYPFSEAMVHPAMFFLKEKCKRVLCIGGGPGGICRELLKYPFIEKVYQVEIDPDVVAISRKYFQHVSGGAWDDRRCELLIRDAYLFLSETSLSFDLIICDLSEPYSGSPAVQFFTEEGFQLVRQRLTPESGMYVTWAGPANPNGMDLTSRIAKTAGRVFPFHYPYFMTMQTFGTAWIMVIATFTAINPLSESPETIDRYLSKYTHDLQYYDGQTHYHMFHLPKNVRTKLSKESRPITLTDPYYISGASR